MEQFVSAKWYADYFTVTCLEWLPLLEDDHFKDDITDSLYFLSENKRASIYAFVIMSNHFHLIWQILGNHRRDAVQRDLLKFTAQQILRVIKKNSLPILNNVLVNAKEQKISDMGTESLKCTYIVRQKFFGKSWSVFIITRAGLFKYPEDYKYSSARFYYKGDRSWKFLIHCDG